MKCVLIALLVVLAFASVTAVSIHPKLQRLSEQGAALQPKSLLSTDSTSSVSAPRARPAWCNAWVTGLAGAGAAASNLSVLRQAHAGTAGANAYIAANVAHQVVLHGFTYVVDGHGRVTSATGNMNPAGVGSNTQWALELMDCMFEGATNALRDSAVVGAGQTAGHIVSPAFGGSNDFNSNAINFFPQSIASNGGAYNTQEQGGLGTVISIRRTLAGCTPTVTITLTYAPIVGALANHLPSIPTGGNYQISVPHATCGGNRAAQIALAVASEQYWRAPGQNAHPNRASNIGHAVAAQAWLNAAADTATDVVHTAAWVNP